MNPIGVFKEVEIDGNPTFVFTLDSPNSSHDSGGSDLPLQPLFLCPLARSLVDEIEEYMNPVRVMEENKFFPFRSSPHFPCSGQTQQLESSCVDESEVYHRICKLPVIPLYWCNNKNPEFGYSCMVCRNSNVGTDYYFCVECDQRYHKECVESPLEIKHPLHPRHSLQLFHVNDCIVYCVDCGDSPSSTFYSCTSCNFVIDTLCAMKSLPIVINHQKRHAHPLTFFPRQDFLACNICGLIRESNPTYVCVRCDFVAHLSCIYFPYVIKISRHPHRVAFTSSLPSGEWSCGVCRREVDNHYGAYACQKCSNYFVHTKCALRRDVWDGKELEGVPEEPEIVVEPFERIADGIILHFTHGHHMRLEVSLIYDHTKFCQACALPIYEGSFYACMDLCDFILHDSCANAPRKIHHPLHPHPLTLKAVANEVGGQFICTACKRLGCGFVYQCLLDESCFKLDVMCASVSEPFQYHGHEHLLFLASDPEEIPNCHVCKSRNYGMKVLNCIECEFMVCFMCATLPYKVRYKHDTHYLTFYNWEEASDSDWCEICEGKLITEVGAEGLFDNRLYAIERSTGFYGCNECCTTLHIHCLLGKHIYMMKPGLDYPYGWKKCHILHNNSNSRPICSERRCQRRCPFNTVYEVYEVETQFSYETREKAYTLTFCCWDCLHT